MALLIGTRDGVFRTSGASFEEARQVLDCGRVLRVRRADATDGALAATQTGLFHSTRGGTWTNLGVPLSEVYSATFSPDRDRLYAGTHPAHVYVSTDSGASWRDLVGFQDLPSRERWHTPRHRGEAHVRSLGVHPDAPERVVVGVEVGGVHVSEDRGRTWEERRTGVQDDVHHLLVLGVDEYVASTGGGLYRTRDVGLTWTRLDDDLPHTYFREAYDHAGVLYAAAARSPPPTWGGERGADAAIYESTDGGDTFERRDAPVSPREFVLAWTELDGQVVAGTNEGTVLVRADDGTWEQTGRVPSSIASLAAISR